MSHDPADDMQFDAYQKRIDAESRGLEAVAEFVRADATQSRLRKVYDLLSNIIDEAKESYELAANTEQADDDVLPDDLVQALYALADVTYHISAVCDRCAAKQTLADFLRHDGKCNRCRSVKWSI